jgi:hypothetical protein
MRDRGTRAPGLACATSAPGCMLGSGMAGAQLHERRLPLGADASPKGKHEATAWMNVLQGFLSV